MSKKISQLNDGGNLNTDDLVVISRPPFASGDNYKINGQNVANLKTSCLVSCYLSSNQSNVTGDGTFYPIVFDTILENKGNMYNPSNGIFTCSITGTYLFILNVVLSNVGAGHNSGFVRLISNGINYDGAFKNPANCRDINNTLNMDAFLQVPLIVGALDTIIPNIVVYSSTKTVNVAGKQAMLNVYSKFSAYLIGV